MCTSGSGFGTGFAAAAAARLSAVVAWEGHHSLIISVLPLHMSPKRIDVKEDVVAIATPLSDGNGHTRSLHKC
jgi:hypothetical protein